MNKEKTILEWLEELPDGYRERALANYDPPPLPKGRRPTNTLSIALWRAFNFEDSPEGRDFWYAVHSWTYRKSDLPPLPDTEPKTDLRIQIATRMAQGMLSNTEYTNRTTHKAIVKESFIIADEIIKEGSK